MTSSIFRYSAAGGDADVDGNHSSAQGGDAGESQQTSGGAGGHASVKGNNSLAEGGRGGRAGITPGGPGGHAHVIGDDCGYFGGEGGEGDQADGRGGRGGVARGLEYFGYCERRARMKLPYGEPNIYPGRGGDKPDTLYYKARRVIVEDFKETYFREHSIPILDPHYVWYDREKIPLSWINDQLMQSGHQWRIMVAADEYVFTECGVSARSAIFNAIGMWLTRPFRRTQ